MPSLLSLSSSPLRGLSLAGRSTASPNAVLAMHMCSKFHDDRRVHGRRQQPLANSYLIMEVASTPESRIEIPPTLQDSNPELAAMAEHAQGFRALLICLCLCLCLLLLSSDHLAMSMDLDGDDFFDVSLDDDDSFSDEVAVAPARRLSGDSFSVINSNTSSNKSGSAFCRLLSLQILDLSNNLLTGELPDCWWEMQALQFMDLSNNSFSGEIPEAPPSHNCSLESLHLAGNGFTGVFPSVVKGCESLATLDIGNNQFFGRIPPWVGSGVPGLKILRLRSNNFTGEIPPEISQLWQLQLLDLANNSLIGPIPREFGKLSAMKNPIIKSTGSLSGSNYQDRIDIIWKGQELIFQRILQLMTGIDLSSNSLSQCIPEELTNLEGLRFLNLSRNNLSCGIPQSIGSLNVLESLDLSLNELSGTIPVSMSSMVSLNTLNLSNNHLSGKIPTGSQLQTLNDPSIYSNNPGLCGPPLDIPCTNASPASNKRNDKDSDQWLYYCVIAGIVFGIWLWCGMILSIPKWRHSVFFFVDRVQYKVMLKLQPIDQYLSKEKSDPFL